MHRALAEAVPSSTLGATSGAGAHSERSCSTKRARAAPPNGRVAAVQYGERASASLLAHMSFVFEYGHTHVYFYFFIYIYIYENVYIYI